MIQSAGSAGSSGVMICNSQPLSGTLLFTVLSRQANWASLVRMYTCRHTLPIIAAPPLGAQQKKVMV